MSNLDRSLKSFTRDLLKKIERDLVPEIEQMAAEMASDLIRKRVQGRGLGIAVSGGSTYPLKPLSPKYIEFRRRSPKLSFLTSPSKSNLTFTGQMIDSIVAVNRNGWIVTFEGGRDDGKSNSQIARYVSRTRPFFFLSGGEQQQIRNMINRAMPALAKRNLTP